MTLLGREGKIASQIQGCMNESTLSGCTNLGRAKFATLFDCSTLGTFLHLFLPRMDFLRAGEVQCHVMK